MPSSGWGLVSFVSKDPAQDNHTWPDRGIVATHHEELWAIQIRVLSPDQAVIAPGGAV